MSIFNLYYIPLKILQSQVVSTQEWLTDCVKTCGPPNFWRLLTFFQSLFERKPSRWWAEGVTAAEADEDDDDEEEPEPGRTAAASHLYFKSPKMPIPVERPATSVSIRPDTRSFSLRLFWNFHPSSMLLSLTAPWQQVGVWARYSIVKDEILTLHPYRAFLGPPSVQVHSTGGRRRRRLPPDEDLQPF